MLRGKSPRREGLRCPVARPPPRRLRGPWSVNQRLLLDTHVLIWALTSPRRLPANVARMVKDRDHVVSPAPPRATWGLGHQAALGMIDAASRSRHGRPRPRSRAFDEPHGDRAPLRLLATPETDICTDRRLPRERRLEGLHEPVTLRPPARAHLAATRADVGSRRRLAVLPALPRAARAPRARRTAAAACHACRFVLFPNMGVGAAVVIRDARGQVLMVQRSAAALRRGQVVLPVRLRRVAGGHPGRRRARGA